MQTSNIESIFGKVKDKVDRISVYIQLIRHVCFWIEFIDRKQIYTNTLINVILEIDVRQETWAYLSYVHSNVSAPGLWNHLEREGDLLQTLPLAKSLSS